MSIFHKILQKNCFLCFVLTPLKRWVWHNIRIAKIIASAWRQNISITHFYKIIKALNNIISISKLTLKVKCYLYTSNIYIIDNNKRVFCTDWCEVYWTLYRWILTEGNTSYCTAFIYWLHEEVFMFIVILRLNCFST